MTWLDWLTIALILAGLAQGITRGWIPALFGILVATVSYVIAAALYPLSAEGLRALPMPVEWSRTIIFVVIFGALHVIISLFVGSLMGGERPRLEGQIPGGFVGFVRGIVVAMAVLGIFAASPFHEVVMKDMKSSPIARPVLGWQKSSMHTLKVVLRITPIGPDRTF